MVVNTEYAKEVINYAKDLDYEYNIKIMILLIFTIISIATIILMEKMQPDTDFKSFVKRLFPGMAWVYLAFTPLSAFFLVRTVSYQFFLNSIITFYLIGVGVFFMLFMLWGKDKFLEFIGIKQKNEYRRYNR